MLIMMLGKRLVLLILLVMMMVLVMMVSLLAMWLRGWLIIWYRPLVHRPPLRNFFTHSCDRVLKLSELAVHTVKFGLDRGHVHHRL